MKNSIFFIFVLTFLAMTKSERKNYDNYVLIVATPQSQAGVNYLNELKENDFTLDFWTPPARTNQDVEVLVPPFKIDNFKNGLTANGIPFRIQIADLQSAIAEESKPQSGTFKAQYDQSSFSLGRYHDYPNIEAYLRQISKENSEIVTMSSMKIKSKGNSDKITHESRALWLLKIGKPIESSEKPGIWIDAGIHAREWIAPATALYFINELTSGFKMKDPIITNMLEKIDFYILPVMNPDGYQYSRTNDRMWRKNRKPAGSSSGWGRRCPGVDLNRNFDWYWSRTGSSSNKCAEDYHGTAAFSEPESQAVRDFLLAHRDTIKSYISMHSYGQIWMYPFGHRRRTYPEDREELVNVAKQCASALKSKYNTDYEIGTGADILYSAAGGSDDWAKAVAKIKYTYLLELRPKEGRGFLLPEAEIIPTGIETWEGVKTLAQEMIKRYPLTTLQTNPTANGESSNRKGSNANAATSMPDSAQTSRQTTQTQNMATTTKAQTNCEDKSTDYCVSKISGWFFGNRLCIRNRRFQRICKKTCKLC